MKVSIVRRLEAMDRAKQFVLDHPFTPPVVRAGVLVTAIDSAADLLRQRGTDQVAGLAGFQGGAGDRADKAKALRLKMGDLSDTAKQLDKTQFPGVAAAFRMPKSRGYQALINSARAFAEATGPIKAAFVERGYAGDFDETFVAEIDALEAAVLRKYSGRQRQRNGTAELDFAARNGLAVVRELGAIVRGRYRSTDPALYAVWKNAARVQSAPQTSESQPANAPAASTPPPTPTPTA